MESGVVAFLKDFYAAYKAGRAFEILSFYERGWKDMSRRFFPESPWPAESEVSPVVDGDKGFLALYGLLSHKHVLTTMDVAPTLGTFIAAWAAYRAFFALAETGVAIAVPPAWAYDIVSELAWHCQQYHELRLRALGLDRSADGAEVGGSADVDADTGGDGGAVELGEGVTETDVVGAWQLPEVLSLLHRAVDGSGIVASLAAGDPPLQADFRLALGYFSMVVLVRLYTKVGDYGSALELARPLNVVADEGPFARIARAHLSLQSYAAFACIMSRRMDDAFRICNRTLGSFQRSPSPVLQSDKEGGASVHFLLRKLGEKLLAMLALCSAVLPGATVDEVVRRALKDKHGDKIERISRAVATTSGSAADADAAAAADVAGLFAISAPGFLALSQTPAPSADVAALRAAGTYYAASALAATHLRALQRDIARRTAGLAQLRSILRLYTSIDIAKLAAYVGCSEETARAQLLNVKISAAVPSIAAPSAPAAGAPASGSEGAGAGAGAAASTSSASATADVGVAASSDPLHFYMVRDTVFVEEARAVFNTTAFFVRNVEMLSRFVREGAVGGDHREYRGGRGGGGGGGGGGARK